MECPYCKKEMKPGYMYNGRQPLQWIPEDEKPSAFAFGTAKGSISLQHKPTFPAINGYRAEAYYCADCRVVMAKTDG